MLLKIDKEYGVLHTRATPAIFKILPQLEGKRLWLKGGGLKIAASQHNLDILSENFPALEIENTEKDSIPVKVRGNYVPLKEPRWYQSEALEKAKNKKSFALFLPPGSGKTKIAIDWAGSLYSQGHIRGVLLVAPKGVHRQWAEEQLPIHCGAPWQAMVWPLKRIGTAENKMLWFCIGIDAIKTQIGKALCHEFISSCGSQVAMIIDESHKIKNAASQRWKAAYELGRLAPYRLAMTGTPIAKDLTDEWAQLKWVDEAIIGCRHKTTFQAQYCIMGGFEGRQVIGHKKIADYKTKVDPYCYRMTKEDIGALPKTYHLWSFDLSEKQLEMISDLKNTLLSKIETGEIVSAANAAVALMKIQQIASGFFKNVEGDTIRLFADTKNNPRISALLDVIDSLEEEKLIIWARFHEEFAMLKEVFGDEAVFYYGACSDSEKLEAKEKFINDTNVRFFISNPSVGGVGLDGLQTVCSHAIYYSNSDNSIDRWQSEDRTNRIGGLGATVYFDLVAKGGIDKRILSRLKMKKSISDMTLKDITELLNEEEERVSISNLELEALNHGEFKII